MMPPTRVSRSLMHQDSSTVKNFMQLDRCRETAHSSKAHTQFVFLYEAHQSSSRGSWRYFEEGDFSYAGPFTNIERNIEKQKITQT